MEEAHPALIGFDQTFEHDFPLILAVGREPSSHEAIVYGLGHYDFRSSPKCAFWNVSYGFVGSKIGLKPHELKSLCVARRASPLIYADALPITIKNAVANKAELRAVVLKEAVTAHVAHIFSHEPVVQRIGLVLLSGLDAPQFQHSVACFQTACRERGIPAVRVPFFYGTNVPKLREAITSEASARIQTIMEGFREAVPPSAVSDAGGLVTAA
ncbi:hypothetical protein [Methylorubrum extorquens]